MKISAFTSFLLLISCAQEPVAKAPVLPALSLQSRTAELEAVVAAAPKAPDKRRMEALLDLLETAYMPGHATAKFASMAKRSLVDEDDAVWILEQGLVHSDASVRMFSAYDLSTRGRPASVPILLLRLKYESEPSVKVWVVDALCKLGNDAAVLELVTLMKTSEVAATAGQTAIRVLKRAGKDPGSAASYPDLIAGIPAVHTHWLETGFAMGRDKPSAPNPLLRARIAERLLRFEGFQLRPVDDARFVLLRSGAYIVADLTLAVSAEETYLRNHALEVLRDLGALARPAGDAVLPLLADKLSAPLAARTLGAIGARKAFPFLVHALRGPDIELAASAAAGIGLLGDPRGREVLAPLVADEAVSMDLRVQAAFGLALLSPGVEFLRKRREQNDFHAPTISELLDEIGRRVR